jgi:hypothetical protein
LGLSVISLVSASQPRIEVRSLIYRKRPIEQEKHCIIYTLNKLRKAKQLLFFTFLLIIVYLIQISTSAVAIHVRMEEVVRIKSIVTSVIVSLDTLVKTVKQVSLQQCDIYRITINLKTLVAQHTQSTFA